MNHDGTTKLRSAFVRWNLLVEKFFHVLKVIVKTVYYCIYIYIERSEKKVVENFSHFFFFFSSCVAPSYDKKSL